MASNGDAVGAARERVERARELVRAGAYLVTRPAVLVYSDRPGCPGYTVEDGRCSCPDATVGQAARLGISCKHALVARWVLAERRTMVFPKRLPPTDDTAWLDAQDAARSLRSELEDARRLEDAASRAASARRLEAIAEEMGR